MTEEEASKQNQETQVTDETVDDLFLNPDDSEIIEAVEGEALDALGVLQESLEKAEKERDDFKNRMMRAAADLENFRRRSNKEKDDLRKYGVDKVVGELLPVIDNFERALEHAETDPGSFLDGVQMIYRQFIGALEKHGVKGFEAVGEKFLPQLHEAIQQVETTEHEAGHVVAQFQKGYHLHDRLIRAALVSVAKAPSEAVGDEAIEENIEEVELEENNFPSEDTATTVTDNSEKE